MANKGPDWITRYQPLFVPLAILFGGVAVAAAIFFTRGSEEEFGVLPPDTSDREVEVSVDDDPGIGDPNAPVTIIELVNYECPFCKSFFEQTFPQIKSVYIDTGKVRLVVRDLPLSFHEPAATKGAMAANCARDQKGDEGYFAYRAEIFARTAGGGAGMPEGDYAVAASKIGLDVTVFNSCLSTEKFKDEVAADVAAMEKLAQDYPDVFSQGIGTPTFFIGKSDRSGTITGRVIAGAQPFESFQRVIDALLE